VIRQRWEPEGGPARGICAAAWCRAGPRPQDRRADGQAAGRDCAARAGQTLRKRPLPGPGRRLFRAARAKSRTSGLCLSAGAPFAAARPGEHWTPKAPARRASAPGDSLTILTSPPTTCCDRRMPLVPAILPPEVHARWLARSSRRRRRGRRAPARWAGQPALNSRREDDAPDRPDRRADTGLGRSSLIGTHLKRKARANADDAHNTQARSVQLCPSRALRLRRSPCLIGSAGALTPICAPRRPVFSDCRCRWRQGRVCCRQ
jgi:hypothetical protein